MFYLYIIIIFLCLVASIINKAARQRFFWIYFSVIFFIEIIMYLFPEFRKNYDWVNLFYLTFLFWYYSKEYKKKYFHISWIISTIFILYLIFQKKIFGIDLLASQSIIYIYLSINWFTNQIKNPDRIKIFKKISFWISSSILLWGTIFLLRIIPGLYFENNDKSFLYMINYIYQTVTIFSYILFLKGLFCKA